MWEGREKVEREMMWWSSEVCSVGVAEEWSEVCLSCGCGWLKESKVWSALWDWVECGV